MSVVRKLSGWILMAVGALPGSLTAAADQAKPNILWISCEDMSPNIGPFNDKLAHTPNLDKLAAAGCVYTKAFSTSPVCSPSRSTIITGVYAATLGTHNHRSSVRIPDRIKPFPTYLREAGYYCTNNSKTDYNFPVPPDAWDENSKQAHWRKRPKADQPFFAVFNLTITHEGHFKAPDRKFENEVKDVKKKDRMDPARVTLPPYIPDTPKTRKDRARYYDMIAQMDIEAGRILKQLDEDGLSTNTVVFFFSDHGEGLPRGKRWLYDSGLHVPMIVRWPGKVDKGLRNDELVSLMDLAPTVLSIADVQIPPYMAGRIFTGPKSEPAPELLYATRDRMDEVPDMMRSVRSDKFKYIKNFYPERPYMMPIKYLEGNPTMQELRRMHEDETLTGPATLYFADRKPDEELYDLTKDPFEVNNLAGKEEYKGELEEMRNELSRWQKSAHDKGFEPDPGPK